MLSERLEQFLKLKTGLVVPIFTSVSMNNANRLQMILLLELNNEFNPFQHEEINSSLCPFILTDGYFNIQELSLSF
jgi:hypothetical protein